MTRSLSRCLPAALALAVVSGFDTAVGSPDAAGPLAPVTVEDGVLFRYRDATAERVSLVGDFNDWDEFARPLERSRNGVWQTVVGMDEGTWAYLYVVDGRWVRDPDNPGIQVESSEEASLLRVRHGRVVAPRSRAISHGSFDLSGSYDRVDQVTASGRLEYRNRDRLHPDLEAVLGRSFGRDRWLWEAALTQPLFRARAADLGIRAYRITDTPDRHRMSQTENSLATFFFREDWRDYHEAEGVAAHATLYAGDVQLTGRWKHEEHRSLSKTTDWGVFGGDKRMRGNPAVEEGTLRSFLAVVQLDTRNSARAPTRGVLAAASLERAGLGGDFEFVRMAADVRRYLKLSRGRYFDFRVSGGVIGADGIHRVAGGGGRIDSIPVQERFYLGGVGTLRATQFKSLTGDRMLLGNAELRVDVLSELQAAVFVDVGDAWIGGVDEADLKADAGIGLQDADSSFRLNIARKVDGRAGDQDFVVSARIRRMF